MLAMSTYLKIQELAKQFHISPSLLRYYEKIGLFDTRHVRRTANGYREYTPATSDRIAAIHMAQLAGFSLKDIQKGLDAWEANNISHDDKVAIVVSQLANIDEKIRQLQHGREYLEKKLAALQNIAP